MRIVDYGLLLLLVLMSISAYRIMRDRYREDKDRHARMQAALHGAPLTKSNIEAWSFLRLRDAAEREIVDSDAGAPRCRA